MKNVDIEVFHIARTQVDREEVQRWLDFIGVQEYQIPSEETCSNPALLIALAAKRCYMSFEPGLNPNVTKVRKDLVAYCDNILASGHGSVLEHATHSFAIENASRVFTAEMNRHRAGWAISEGSLRYIRFQSKRDVQGNKVPNTGLPWWMPPSMRDHPKDDLETKKRKEKTREIFTRAFTHQEDCYEELVSLWDLDNPKVDFPYKKHMTSCFRRIIGLGVATGGVWTGNMRALRHVVTMRAEPAAEEEICYVFSKIAKLMTEKEPHFFSDFEQTPEGFWRPKYRKV